MRCAALLFVCALLATGVARAQDYAADVEFALTEIEKRCAHFFELKKIDWDAVKKTFRAEVKKVTSPGEHLVLMERLLARVKDGHAAVHPGPKGKGVRPPDMTQEGGLGMHLVRSKKDVVVKAAWGPAANANIAAGSRIEKIDGKPADAWLAARAAQLADRWSFSTAQHRDGMTRSFGMSGPIGERIEVRFRDPKGKRRKRTLAFDAKTRQRPEGPAFVPEDARQHGEVVYWTIGGKGKKNKGAIGYLSIRKCQGDLPDQVDGALSALGDVDGLILDFRGNTGGGFDHEALMGRFIPKGKKMRGQTVKGRVIKRYEQAGPHAYAGPIVVIVNATAVSAAETASGIFKEDGRAYMIGESPTAGMSSSKVMLDLPSGLFRLRVSVASNMGRFNEGRGIEGIGVIPHEIVEYDAKDLAKGKDTLIERAVKILKRFPSNKVPYEKRFR